MEFTRGQSLSFQAGLLAVLVTPSWAACCSGDPEPFCIHRMRTVTEPTTQEDGCTVLYMTVKCCHGSQAAAVLGG